LADGWPVDTFEEFLESTTTKPTEPETESTTAKPTEPEAESTTVDPTEPETESTTAESTKPEAESTTAEPTEPKTESTTEVESTTAKSETESTTAEPTEATTTAEAETITTESGLYARSEILLIGMTLEQFNTNKAAITTEVANNLNKTVDAVTLTLKSESNRRRRMNDNLKVLCEVKAASEEEVAELEATMISEEFARALEADIRLIDSTFALIDVNTSSPETKIVEESDTGDNETDMSIIAICLSLVACCCCGLIVVIVLKEKDIALSEVLFGSETEKIESQSDNEGETQTGNHTFVEVEDEGETQTENNSESAKVIEMSVKTSHVTAHE